MAKHTRHKLDAEGWTEWLLPRAKGYRLGCCDCGLVHEMDFRVKAGRVQFRARRHTRATATARVWRKRAAAK